MINKYNRAIALGAEVPPPLTEREELVLRMIVQHYVLTASPVGSRFLSKHMGSGEPLSAATLRNVMADLEEKGFITHPHTSAGRVPTDRGYRFYVDTLSEVERLTGQERTAIRRHIDPAAPPRQMMKDASRLLGAISLQLGIVTAPEILDAVLERIDLVALSSTRLLAVLTLKSGYVRTVTLEMHDLNPPSSVILEDAARQLNERLSGRTLRHIRDDRMPLLGDLANAQGGAGNGGILRLFLRSADKIFANPSEFERVHVSYTQDILEQPEFSSLEGIRGIVKLIEDEDVIITLLERYDPLVTNAVEITIGSEHGDQQMQNYSLVTSRYSLGDQTTGRIALIGPKRMNYSKMIAVVEYVTRTITEGG